MQGVARSGGWALLMCIMQGWCVLCSFADCVLATCAECLLACLPNSQLPPPEITVIREIMGDTGVQGVVRSGGVGAVGVHHA